jgi:uncharacterized protein (DUF305 family)
MALALLASGAVAMAHPSIDIVAANWHFTPSTITVEAGQPATLRLTSTSGTHGIASDELGIAATTIGPGRFVEVSFTPHAVGTFKVHCSIFCGAGHADMVLTVIVTGAAAAAPAPTANTQPAAMPAPPSMPKAAPKVKPLMDDRYYITMMVTEYQKGLQVARLGAKTAHHAEIRSIAKTIAAQDTAGIVQLKKWYASWYGSKITDVSSPTSYSYITGATDTDRALIIYIIQHGAGTASLSLVVEQGLTHPDLRRFARSSADAQLADVQILWHWYSGWYPVM